MDPASLEKRKNNAPSLRPRHRGRPEERDCFLVWFGPLWPFMDRPRPPATSPEAGNTSLSNVPVEGGQSVTSVTSRINISDFASLNRHIFTFVTLWKRNRSPIARIPRLDAYAMAATLRARASAG